jgi:transcriptional regulator with XRE-family HTH domain
MPRGCLLEFENTITAHDKRRRIRAPGRKNYTHEKRRGCHMDDRVLDRRAGENLKRLRQRIGISQQKLAELAGTTRASVSYAETGAHAPLPSTLEKFAEVLEVPLDIFYERPEDIASLLRLNKILTEDVMRARQEGDEERLQDLYPELERVTKLINRFGPFTEPESSRKRRERQRIEHAGHEDEDRHAEVAG